MNMSFADIGITVGIAVGRGVLGWFENAIKDKKITAFEWSQLGSTIVRISILTVGISYGFNLEAPAAAFAATAGDFLLSALKKKVKA